jgi:hypothetical protein
MSSPALRYQGYFNDSITGQLTTLVDTALEESCRDYSTRSRLRALMVEQVQNIQRYSARPRQGTVEIGEAEGGYFVETRNAVTPEERQWIDARLKDITSSDRPTLRRRFREAMHRPFGDDDRGAGLGFLFLAKESRRALSYRFVEGQELMFELTSYL